LIFKFAGLSLSQFEQVVGQGSEVASLSVRAPKLLTRLLVNYHEVLVENVVGSFLPVRREKRNNRRPFVVLNV